MFKQILLWLFVVIISNGIFSPTLLSAQCVASRLSDLSAESIEATSVQIHYQPTFKGTINQFRIKPIDTNQWQYSTIHTNHFRVMNQLDSDTQYEFQVSYICPNRFWTAFSTSAYFTTPNENSEEEEMNEEETEEEMNEEETEEEMNEEETEEEMNEEETEEEMNEEETEEEMNEEETEEEINEEETEEEMNEEQIDSISGNYLILQDREVYCEDTLVCVELSAVALNTTMHTVFSWETQILEQATIRLNEELIGSVYYQADSFHLALGKLPINFTTGWEKGAALLDTISVLSICYTPIFGQVEQSNIELETTTVLRNRSAGIDTLVNPPVQNGELTFATCEGIELGGGTCDPVNGSGLSTSSISNTAAYIYNSYHNTDYKNQFRYRQKRTTKWSYTDIQNTHFRRLTDLKPGTTYEFQANQECPDGSFSDYSISFYFSTFGESTEEILPEEEGEEIIVDEACVPVDSTGLSVSTIKQYFVYVYTPQPLGPVNNQFRYRPVGTFLWLYSSISATSYRYLENLRDGTLYEYQVSHECSEGVWSEYSGSYRFTTLPSIN